MEHVPVLRDGSGRERDGLSNAVRPTQQHVNAAFSLPVFCDNSFIVSISDAFLKPLLLWRGVETPMLVILIGAIGGAMALGILGLFLGAVVLALGYELLVVWMSPDEEATSAGALNQDA